MNKKKIISYIFILSLFFFSLNIYISIIKSLLDGSIIKNNNYKTDYSSFFPFESNKELAKSISNYQSLEKIKRYYYSYFRMTEKIESSAQNRVPFRYKLLEFHALVIKFFGIRIFPELGCIVLKNNYLCLIEKAKSSPNMIINNVKMFNLWLKRNSNTTKLVYIQYPCKLSKYNDILPSGIVDDRNKTSDHIIKELKNNDIDCFDIREAIHKEKINHHDLFLQTDHHWKTETGLWATREICKYLQNQYGYLFNFEVLLSENYNIKTINNCFLGSIGKKLTLSFTKPEDLTVLYPKFNNSLTYNNLKSEIKGSFESIFLDKNKVEKRDYDYYSNIDYHFYKCVFGGFYTISNKYPVNNITCLLLVDSYNQVISPFLSLMFKKLIVISPRGFNGSIRNCIKYYKPDLVCIAYMSRIPPTDKNDFDWALYQFE